MNPTPPLGGQADPWSRRRAKKAARLARIAPWMKGQVLETGAIVEALQALLEPSDVVALEGDNQKQADFLSRSLVQVDPAKLHDLHLLISSVSRPEHLTLFERGIARKIDLAYAGPQSVRLAQLLEDGKLEIGAIHTYVELYARMFADLMPDVALICAEKADRQGNLYTGPNTEDTPTIVEATAFHDGVVVVQVNEIVDELPRVDIPASWVDVVVAGDRPYQIEPLFTRDPRLITEVDADAPSAAQIARVKERLAAAVADIRKKPGDLTSRLNTPQAKVHRAASIEVRKRLAEQWDATNGVIQE
jgi:malonate decarboxylase alpha subunit